MQGSSVALECVAAAACLHIPHHGTPIGCHRHSCAAVRCDGQAVHLAGVNVVVQLRRCLQVPHPGCAILGASDGKPAASRSGGHQHPLHTRPYMQLFLVTLADMVRRSSF